MSDPTGPADVPRRPPPDPTWRERIQSLIHQAGVELSVARVALAVAAVAVAIVAAVVVLHPLSSTARPEDSLPLASAAPSSASSSAVTSAPSTTAPQLIVQAAGAVVHPGVYTIASTARVNDLMTAAGGFAPDADPDQVELAATLTDGERVYVPRVGETVSPPGGASGSSSAASQGPIDLNRASESDLEALPGIGPALAQAIVDYRTQHGAFTSIDDLTNVRGIGPAKLEQLRPLVKV
ncbi:MAG TPA: helix-hairpin-helix domain-containing protein [Acidimicrobiales bacterium]